MKVFGKNVFNELKDNVKAIKKVYLANNFNDKEIIDFIKIIKLVIQQWIFIKWMEWSKVNTKA